MIFQGKREEEGYDAEIREHIYMAKGYMAMRCVEGFYWSYGWMAVRIGTAAAAVKGVSENRVYVASTAVKVCSVQNGFGVGHEAGSGREALFRIQNRMETWREKEREETIHTPIDRIFLSSSRQDIIIS